MTRRQLDLPRYAQGLFKPARYKVLYGGRGAGRSWSCARALLLLGLQRPGLRILCARELQASIKDSVHRLLADQIQLLGLPYEVLRTEIRGPGDTLFIFEGLRHNVTKIKSLEGIDVCWVEEAERVSGESWDVLVPTIRKDGSEIWITFNPDLEDDATYRRFVLGVDGKGPPPGTWLCKVSGEANPWFPDELRPEREYLYRVDPDAAAHVWGGECRRASDAQILKGKVAVEEFEPEPRWWDGPYHGADWGFAQDPCVLVRCWVAKHVLYVEHESYHINLDLDRIADTWKRDVPGCEKFVVRADPSRPDTIKHVRDKGFPQIQGAPTGKGSVEDGIAHLRQYERIVIHSRCKHVIDEARHYSYKVDRRSGDVLPEVVDAHNHTIDSIRYALAPLIRSRGDLSGVTSFGNEELEAPSPWTIE